MGEHGAVRVDVYLDRHRQRGPTSQWTARAYDRDNDEHVWSSEAANTAELALGEIGRAIDAEWSRG